jgi:hypothetical protein
MGGVQTIRRLRVVTPLTPPLRGDPLRKEEGCLSAACSEDGFIHLRSAPSETQCCGVL